MFDELSAKRLEICKQCPLYKEGKRGAVCDDSKYISPDGSDWSFFAKKGYVKGCNCNLTWKTKGPSNHCIIHKW